MISRISSVSSSDIHQNLSSYKRMENLPCEKEVSSPPLEKREETPEKAMTMAMVEPENVLTEKNGGQQNIVARRNNKDDGNKVTPPNVKVPPKKLFGFPERYRSPTDSIMSPTSRGLLARNRKSVRPVELPTYLPRKSG